MNRIRIKVAPPKRSGLARSYDEGSVVLVRDDGTEEPMPTVGRVVLKIRPGYLPTAWIEVVAPEVDATVEHVTTKELRPGQ